MRLSVLIVIIVLTATAFGCAIEQRGMFMKDTIGVHFNVIMKNPPIKPGQTDKEVYLKLGSPDDIRKLSDGTEVFVYHGSHAVRGFYFPLAGWLYAAKGEYDFLVFVKDGEVSDTKFIKTRGFGGAGFIPGD